MDWAQGDGSEVRWVYGYDTPLATSDAEDDTYATFRVRRCIMATATTDTIDITPFQAPCLTSADPMSPCMVATCAWGWTKLELILNYIP